MAFAAGIGAWFVLGSRWQWLALIAGCVAVSLGALALMRDDGRYPWLRQAIAVVAATIAAGCCVVWLKSAVVGQPPIDGPMVGAITGRILEREELPAQERVRLVLAMREADGGRPIRVRVNVAAIDDRPGLSTGALVRVRARLMPPAPPMFPGGYDFARAAWFGGLSATGSALGPAEVLSGGGSGTTLAGARAMLSHHVYTRLPGPSGGIASALASGDRGAIAPDDAQAMRDSGLAHLLSISGLHVSALVAATYLVAIRLLALWPWLALRVRLPLLASGIAAGAGVGYTLLSGAEVPTVRSCIGALLVLAALALGREALSLRLLAVAALFVMLFWPESVVGPSFQMSFAAVIAIVALGNADPARRLFAPREESLAARGGRYLLALFVTGLVIELALLPIGMWHFHRAGIYGSVANLVAIPLTTVLTMPLIALALFLDIAGLGAPAWWLAGKTIDLMLALAHWIAAQPGAVSVQPAMDGVTMAGFVIGGLWLALWRGKARLWGLLPLAAATVSLLTLRPPDILVSGDGRHIGITGVGNTGRNTGGGIAGAHGGDLLVLRESRSDFARDNLAELAGTKHDATLIADWPGARCSRDFCAIDLERGGRIWRLLISRSHERVSERELAAACDLSDIVIADRWLPRSCQPKWFVADRNMLDRSGGLTIDLGNRRITTVAHTQGEHGWWRPRQPAPKASTSQSPSPKKPPPTAPSPQPLSFSGTTATGSSPARASSRTGQ